MEVAVGARDLVRRRLDPKCTGTFESLHLRGEWENIGPWLWRRSDPLRDHSMCSGRASQKVASSCSPWMGSDWQYEARTGKTRERGASSPFTHSKSHGPRP